MELSFPMSEREANDLTVVFRNGDTAVRVGGFYDGDSIAKVRFLPMLTGTWHWRASGASCEEGSFLCERSQTKHGPVRADGYHFCHHDGAVFVPFGTTVYALLHQSDEKIRQTLNTLANSPFNKVRLCLFPKDYDLVKEEPPFFHSKKIRTENGTCIARISRFGNVWKT